MNSASPTRSWWVLLAAPLLAGTIGCASTPETRPPPESRYDPPASHRKGAVFLYEGTLSHLLTVRRGEVPMEPVLYEWTLTLRDFVTGDPGPGATEIITHARVQTKGGEEAPFEGITFDLHRPGGGVEPVVGERAFDQAMALIHFPRQAGLPGDGAGRRSWTEKDRLKLSNQGVIDVEFRWEARPPSGDGAGLLHLERRWESKAEGQTEGRTEPAHFVEEFWLHPGQGHIVRYRRNWIATWGGRPGQARVEEEVHAEIWLIDSRLAPAEGEAEVPAEFGALKEIFAGFGSSPERREETERRLEAFRRDFPDSPFEGCLPPVEAALNAIPEVLHRVDSEEGP